LQEWINASINSRDAAKLVLQKEGLRTSSIDLLDAAKDLAENVPGYVDCVDLHHKVIKTIKDAVNPVAQVQQIQQMVAPALNQDANKTNRN